jgi:hypothetical protein
MYGVNKSYCKCTVRPLYRYRIRYVSLPEETITQHMQWEVVISNVYVAPLVVV